MCKPRRISARQRANSVETLSDKFFAICQRSAICIAWGAPFLMAAAYSDERSRLTISTLGCFSNQAETVSTDRSGIMRDYFKKAPAPCDHIPMNEKAIIPSEYPLQAGRSLFK